MSKFKTAAIFSSNMVLQREKPVLIFGEGKNGDIVKAEIDGITASAKVRGEKWQLQLPPHKAGSGYTLKVSCGDCEKVFTNVVYGEVWLAGGQSNMELELQNCAEKEALTTDKDPDVRFYYTPKKSFKEKDFLECEEKSGWTEFSAENAKCWSAVGYFFAREVSEKLGVTVGLIGCNWGGSSASCWMSRESLEKDSDTNEYLMDIKRHAEGKTPVEIEAEWEKYWSDIAEWNRKVGEFYQNNPFGTWEECLGYAGPMLYPGPPSEFNPMSATVLYRSMIQRVCPYTLKGFIYYQGESDDQRPKTYYKLFSGLIGLWRKDWGDDSLPFLFVQLPMHRYKADPDFKNWCHIREAQMKVYNTVKNTGIAVALDKGQFDEIHPTHKLPIGHRLALQALYGVYGLDNLEEEAFGPMYKDCLYGENEIELRFDHCRGFKIDGEPKGFEIAGEDKEFKSAEVKIEGDRILVSSSEVREPLYVRYNWTNYAEVTVFGENGLPLAPFRTSVNDEKGEL